jgi:hypothetical protein
MATEQLTIQIDAKGNAANELKALESGVIRFVGAVSAAVAAVATIGFPVASSAAFQRELLEAAKTTDYTREETNALKDGLRDLSKQIDVTAPDLAKIATMGGQLGIGQGGNVTGLLAFTEEIARAVTALDIPAEEASTAFGKLINIFNIPPNEFRNAISALNEVSNSSNATATELFDVARRIGNLDGSVSFPQAAALSAAMIDLGLTSETAGTTVTKIFANMRAKAGEFAAFMGMSTKDWVDIVESDGLKALDQFVTRLNSIPSDDAARVKVALAGGGRIFSAVGKLQEQQKRGAIITAEAVRLEVELQRAREGRGGGANIQASLEDVAIQQRIDDLKEQAVQVSVVARLTAKAEEAYRNGNSAFKEQQVVLGGLSRQWVVFTNRAEDAARVIGDSLLGPLTGVIKTLGASLGSDTSLAQIKRGVEEVASAVRVGVTVFREFTDSINDLGGEGGGIDLGALIKVSALLAAVGVLKLLGGAVAGVVRYAVGGIAPLAALSNSIFGVAAATNTAATATARTGGVLNALAASAASNTARVVALAAAQTKYAASYASLNTRMAAVSSATTVAQARLAATYTGLRANLRSVSAVTAELMQVEARRNAALAAGDNRGAAGLAARISRLNNIRTAALAAGASLDRLANIQSRLTQRGKALDVSLAASQSGFTRASVAAKAYANTLITLTARYNVFAVVPVAIHATTRALGLATKGVSRLIARIGQLIVVTAGLQGRWVATMGVMATSALLVEGAVRLVSVAVSRLTRLLGSLISGAFFVWIAADLLEFLGLFEPLKKGLVSVLKYFGFFKNGVPAWLKSAEDLEKLTLRTEEQIAALKRAKEAAAGLNATKLSALNYIALDAGVKDAFSPNKDDPLSAYRNQQEALESIIAAEGERSVLADRRMVVEKEIVKAKEEQARLDAEAARTEEERQVKVRGAAKRNQKPVTEADNLVSRTASTLAKQEAAEGAAYLKQLEVALAAVADGEEEIKNLDKAMQNFVANSLDAATAQSLLGIEQEGQLSLMSRLVDANEQVVRSREASIAAEKASSGEQRSTADGKADAETLDRLKVNAELAGIALSAAQDEFTALRNDLAKIPGMTAETLALIERFVTNTDAAGAKRLSKLAQDYNNNTYTDFKNRAGGTAISDDLAEVFADSKATEAMRDLYKEWAEVATAAAERAKNAVSNAIQDAKTRAEALVGFLEKINQSVRKNQQTAANQTADRGEDATIRKMDEATKLSYDREKALIDRNFAGKMRGFDEQLAGGLNVSKNIYEADKQYREANFELDEKYRKISDAQSDKRDKGRASRTATDEIAEFQRLIALAAKLKAESAATVAALDDPSLKTAEQNKLLAEREVGINRLKAVGSELETVLQSIAAIQPIGGEQIVAASTIDKLKNQLEGVSVDISVAQLSGASKAQAIFSRSAGEYAQLANEMDERTKTLNMTIDQMATSLGTTGESVRSMAEDLLLVSGSARAANLELEALRNAGTANLGNVPNSDQANAFLEQMKASRLLEVDIKAALDTKKLVGDLKADPAVQGLVVPAKLEVDPTGAEKVVAGLAGKEISLKVSAAAEEADQKLADMQRAGVINQETIEATARVKKRALDRQSAKQAAEDAASFAQDAALAAKAKAKAVQLTPTTLPTVVAVSNEEVRSTLIDLDAKLPVTVVVKNKEDLNLTAGGATGRKDGGYIDVLKLATGGPVFGAGTATSDSIPAWLSNGEYVMDADSTSTFGQGFFAMLQKLAKGGKSGVQRFVSALTSAGVPKFATGGPVSSRPAGFFSAGGIVNDFKDSRKTSEMMEVNINMGGKRVSIQAEREQANSLVGILRNFERG